MTQTVPTSEDIKEILLQLNNFKSGLLCREGERIDKKLSNIYRYHFVDQYGKKTSLHFDHKYDMFQQAIQVDAVMYMLNVSMRPDNHWHLIAFPRI